ncbi:uncharacterized protein [Haliotis asinina]|uniref:uncharacterized protein n=1 Tax=Haliotis asinina TaxID=109174 RepID=UPI0035321011
MTKRLHLTKEVLTFHGAHCLYKDGYLEDATFRDQLGNVKMAAVFLSLLYALCLASFTSATYKVAQRRLQTASDWQLIDTWTFDTGYVRFNYNITFPRTYSPMKFLFYTQDQFFQANEGSKSCEEKLSILQFAGSGQQVLTLDAGMTQAGCMQRYDSTMGDSVSCNGRLTFNVDRGMMWYVVANRCGSGIDTWYYIDNMEDREGETTRYPGFPPYSGQSKATFTALTLIPFLVLRQCLA